MAATATAERLTEAHRKAQARISWLTMRDMLRLWPLLDPDNLDGSLDRWLSTVVPQIQARRGQSARLAATYMSTFRTLELGVTATPFAPILDPVADPKAVSTSLLVTGPASLRSNLAKGVPPLKAIENAQANTARAAARHALNGGRGTISNTVDADPVALGWARVTSGKPCAFCAMLASRGPVYLSESSAEVRADGESYHDGCHCTAEPVFREDAEWPAGAREFEALWKQTTRGLSGKDALRAFRRVIDARNAS